MNKCFFRLFLESYENSEKLGEGPFAGIKFTFIYKGVIWYKREY